jgi:hypothetical protein
VGGLVLGGDSRDRGGGLLASAPMLLARMADSSSGSSFQAMQG